MSALRVVGIESTVLLQQMTHLFKYSLVCGAKCGGMIFRHLLLRTSHTEIAPVYYLNIIQRGGPLFAKPIDEIDVEFLRL